MKPMKVNHVILNSPRTNSSKLNPMKQFALLKTANALMRFANATSPLPRIIPSFPRVSAKPTQAIPPRSKARAAGTPLSTAMLISRRKCLDRLVIRWKFQDFRSIINLLRSMKRLDFAIQEGKSFSR